MWRRELCFSLQPFKLELLYQTNITSCSTQRALDFSFYCLCLVLSLLLQSIKFNLFTVPQKAPFNSKFESPDCLKAWCALHCQLPWKPGDSNGNCGLGLKANTDRIFYWHCVCVYMLCLCISKVAKYKKWKIPKT